MVNLNIIIQQIIDMIEDAYFSAEITPFDDKGKPMSKNSHKKTGKIEKGVRKTKVLLCRCRKLQNTAKKGNGM